MGYRSEASTGDARPAQEIPAQTIPAQKNPGTNDPPPNEGVQNMILITGATGFVGNAVVGSLLGTHPLRAVSRVPSAAGLPYPVEVVSGDLRPDQDWSEALSGITRVVHCAARVHIMNDHSKYPLNEFRHTNVVGTLRLARQAALAGVKRFIFLSSVKVNGERTVAGSPFNADEPPNPEDPYGISKKEAEEGLLTIATETGMEVVIIRPPLVYGPGVKANFLSMMDWLARDVPLPLGSITENRRSLVALDNLVDLIGTCLTHPAAANQTFLVSDGESLSTTDLLRRMGSALGHPAKLVPVPVQLLQLGAALIGKRHVSQRLCDSLEVDISKTRELLAWNPPITVDEGLRKTAAAWLGRQHNPRH